MGRNNDNELPIPGLLLVNKRGIAKHALPWATLAPNRVRDPAVQWTSRYGSITLTALGRDFPDGGMNEAGLVVEEMSLAQTAFPRYQPEATLSQSEWIQYQLDNFATVREVLDHLDSVGISGWGWHFLVADGSGECAAIEFIEGKALRGRDARISGCVLTNDSLADSSQHLTQFRGFGGSQPIPESRDSLSRFVRCAERLQLHAHTPQADDAAFGFELLSAIDQGEGTQRSILYEVTARKLHWRTQQAPQVKSIDLNRIDFSTQTPTQMLDLDSSRSGDITQALMPYNVADNRRVVASFVHLIHSTPWALKVYQDDLKRAGLAEKEYIELVAHHPEASRH